MTLPTEDYREVLRRRYSEFHAQAAANPPSAELFAYYDRVYRLTFGPLLPADRNAAVFELGCVTGSFLHYLRSAGYRNVTGVDSDESSIAAAKKLGVEGAEAGDAYERLSREKGSYDAVVAIDVLEHFRKDELFPLLRAMHGALRPGGVVIWRVPNAAGPFFGRIRYGDLTHENAFTRLSAHQALTAAGFDSVESRGEKPVVTGARSLLRAALWAGIVLLARVYLFAESFETAPILEPNLLVRARRP